MVSSSRMLFAKVSIALLCALSLPLAASAQDEPARWESKAKASYVRTSGNTDSETLAADVESAYEPNPNRYYIKASALYAEQNDLKSSNRWFLEGRYERAFTERLFGWALASYLKDRFAGYDSQILVGPGVGYYFIKAETMTLKGLAGVLYTLDDYVGTNEDDYATGKVSGDFKWQISESLGFRQFAELRNSLEDTDVYFAVSETSLDVKMSDKLSLGVSYIVNYQNDPPVQAEHTDTRFITSVVVSF